MKLLSNEERPSGLADPNSLVSSQPYRRSLVDLEQQKSDEKNLIRKSNLNNVMPASSEKLQHVKQSSF